MITKRQINNVRQAYRFLTLNDVAIVRLVEGVQAHIDNIKYNWVVRARVEGDERLWSEIEPRKIELHQSLLAVRCLYREMMRKHPKLVAVQITEKSWGKDVYEIRWDEKE